MKMIAAVLRTQGLPRPYASSKPMTIEQVDLAPPGPGEVLSQIIGGGIVISAGLPTSTAQFSYLHGALVSDEKSIRGCYMGSCVPRRDIPRFIGLYKRGKLPVQKLHNGFTGFEQINEGFDKLAGGSMLRQVLRPHA